MQIDEQSWDLNIDRLIPALIKAMKDFENEDEEPYALYVDRDASDGTWDACFSASDHSDLETCMTRWTSGEEASQALELCKNNNAHAVAEEIVMGWDTDWDS